MILKLKIKILTLSVLFLIGLLTLYLIDPAFKRKVTFDTYSVQYEWRIFNNSFCNSKTTDQCFTNKTNKVNAEIELYLKLTNHVEGNKQIENKLMELVQSTYRFDRRYIELTQTNTIQIDSIKKYKDKIFR